VNIFTSIGVLCPLNFFCLKFLSQFPLSEEHTCVCPGLVTYTYHYEKFREQAMSAMVFTLPKKKIINFLLGIESGTVCH
jgi:hypothetical protein